MSKDYNNYNVINVNNIFHGGIKPIYWNTEYTRSDYTYLNQDSIYNYGFIGKNNNSIFITINTPDLVINFSEEPFGIISLYTAFEEIGSAQEMGGIISIRVIPYGTRYNLNIDNTSINYYQINYGESVSMYGDWAISGNKQCSVYVFKKEYDPSTQNLWNLRQTLSIPVSLTYFGYFMNIYKNYILVGVPQKDLNGTDAGIANLYKLNDTTDTWDLLHEYIQPSGIAGGDLFGQGVKIAEYNGVKFLLIRSSKEELSSPYPSVSNMGTYHIFYLDEVNDTYTEIYVLYDSSVGVDGYFGDSIDVYQAHIAISCINASTVYIFENILNIIPPSGTITRVDASSFIEGYNKIVSYSNENFGSSIAFIDELNIFVGAPTALYFNPGYGASPCGFLYHYTRDDTFSSWSNGGYFTAGEVDSLFGSSVTHAGKYIFIGSPNSSGYRVYNTGGVHVLIDINGVYRYYGSFYPDDTADIQNFGSSIDLNYTVDDFIIGAPDGGSSSGQYGYSYVFNTDFENIPIMRITNCPPTSFLLELENYNLRLYVTDDDNDVYTFVQPGYYYVTINPQNQPPKQKIIAVSSLMFDNVAVDYSIGNGGSSQL